uniref:mandelate racemase/muconate lactonizing enzyme family protein n=1 Tax=Pararhizobium sp. IMCC3301 TaxID=3067904 RepID=UPI0027423960|nr:mandelate racemase/muconate lactonizing enzyme family protein [Pararhizobium sp. IMCC3301]
MSRTIDIDAIELISLRVSPRSEWLFLKVTSSDGLHGVGEATMEGHELAVKAAIKSLAERICGHPEPDDDDVAQLLVKAAGDSHAFTAVSAFEQALWDIRGKRRDLSVAALFGGALQDCRLYANINRGIYERTPEGFARTAQDAIAAGFTAVKIAPFDDLDWTCGPAQDGRSYYDAGLARIAACRAALGEKIALSIDCHWRFDPETACQLVADVRDYGLFWIECPIAETRDAISDIRKIRQKCNAQGVLLAGLESLNGRNAFADFLVAEAVDVIMPDVKYAGGLSECQKIARLADEYGVFCCLHNPTGPVCHAASLQLASTLPNCPLLEYQFNETPLFHDIVGAPFPPLVDGCAALPPGPGLGIELNRDLEAISSAD